MIDPVLLEHLEPAQYYQQWLKTYFPVRPDGRKIDEPRQIQIQPGSIGTADGSVLVRLGSTTVVAGVKAEIGEASLDNPGCGFVVPNVHFAAGASPSVRPGPPSDQVQELTARLNDQLKCAGCIDPASLAAPLGGLMWTLYIDLAVLNDDGNVWDALWLALVASLQNTLLPDLELDESGSVVYIKENGVHPLVVQRLPVAISSVFIPERYKTCFIADPSATEETLFPTTLTILYDLRDLSLLQVSLTPSRHAPSVPDLQAMIQTHASLIRPLLS